MVTDRQTSILQFMSFRTLFERCAEFKESVKDQVRRGSLWELERDLGVGVLFFLSGKP